MNFSKIIFIISMIMIFYIYFGYPAFVYILAKIRARRVNKNNYTPQVSILTAAYNEEKCIEASIKNKLQLDYPSEKVEMIVISDGSTDKTSEIVRKYEPAGVRLIEQFPRAGKTQALNLAVPCTRGEIIVFADANSMYHPEALKKLLGNFNDPEVGYVTGKMIYINPDGSLIGDGCSAYMKYENFLRANETMLGSIVGVDGGIDAVRKSLYKPMYSEQLPDFILPLKVIEQGYRVVYEPEAILKEPTLSSVEDEYQMRVRVSLRALWAIKDMKNLLSIKKYSWFAFQLWSHKVLRYLTFFFLIVLYLSNFFLLPGGNLYRISFFLQNSFYFVAILSMLFEKKSHNLKGLLFAHYFLLLNLASGHAFLKFLLGKKQVVWNPRKGA